VNSDGEPVNMDEHETVMSSESKIKI